MKPAAMILLVVCVAWTAAATAQADCPRRLGEDDSEWEDRCNREASIERYGQQLKNQRNTESQRTALISEPALVASKNPLLGHWSLPALNEGQSDDFLSQLPGLLTSINCGPLIGVAELEFLPDRMISIAGDGEQIASPFNYRGRKNGVFVVTPASRPLLFFRFLAPDRIQLGTIESCVLTRQGKTVAAGPSSPAAAVVATPAAKRAYSCPDGSLAVVLSCDNASASANCTVEFPSWQRNMVATHT
jgi:hypothetical protein